MEMTVMKNLKYALLVFLGACSYGILSTFVKMAYDRGFTVGEVTGSMALIGAAMTWVVAEWMRRTRAGRTATGTQPQPAANWSQVLKLMAVGTTTGMTSIVYYYALQYITASLAIVLLFQFTWLGVMLEAIVQRRRPETPKLVALVVLLGGTVVASGMSGSSFQSVSWIGIGMGLLAAISYTLMIFFSGRVAVELPSALRTAWMMTGALVIVFIVFPPAFLVNGALWNGLWVWGGLLAFFGSLIPPLLFMIGVPHTGSGLATILGAVELPVASSMAFFVLGETVTAMQWIGVVAILIGVALPELMRLQRERYRVSTTPNE
jgi:drug/metabolite transporter (DMT)-like permease